MNFKIQLKSLKRCVVIFASITLFGWISSAEEAPSSIFPNPNWQETLIKDNITISEWFDSMADGIDVFLAGKRFTKKRNESKVTVETSLFYSEIENFSDATSFNVNLRLPNVEEYWQITFTSYDETKERGLSRSYLRQNGREQDYGATLGFFRKLGNIRTAFQPRIGFAGKPKISHSLSFESVADVKGDYRVNPKLEFYASADRGTGIFQALNFQFVLSPDYTLTVANEGDYEDRTHNYNVTHGLSIRQWVDDMSSMNYGVYFNFNNVPNYQLSEYIVSVAWNRLVYKNILDIQLMPHLNFNRDRDYAGYYGIVFNIRINF